MVRTLLVCADNAPSSFAAQCRNAFAQLGHEISTFNYRQFQLHRSSITASLMNLMLKRTVLAVQPELVLVIKGEAIQAGTISNIRKAGITTANWILDEPFGKFGKFNRVTNLNEYDHVFSFDDGVAQQLTKQGIPAAYLPVGADPALHHEVVQVAKRKYQREVAFMGSHHPKREELFTKLSTVGIPITVSGYRWNTVAKNSPLAAHIEPEVFKANKSVKDCELMCRYFNLTKINLNLHHAQAVRGGASLRLFECTATNSFLMCDNLPGLDRLYKPNKEMVFYNDAADLRRKIEYYLAHDAERNKIANAGQQRTLKEHKVVDRVREIVQTMGT